MFFLIYPIWSCILFSLIFLFIFTSFTSQWCTAHPLELLFHSVSDHILGHIYLGLPGHSRRCDRSEKLFIAKRGRKVMDNLRVTRMPGDIAVQARMILIRKDNVYNLRIKLRKFAKLLNWMECSMCFPTTTISRFHRYVNIGHTCKLMQVLIYLK